MATASDDEEWTIGVSDVPPWELSALTERPPALPAEQSAPWEALRQEQAPWDRAAAVQAAPWDTPADPQPAPWDARPADSVPWDRPAPFSLDDDAAADPYDAFAPLADDFASQPAPARQARPRPNQPPMPAADSVFGDIFAAPLMPEPIVTRAQAIDMPTRPETEAVQPDEPSEAAVQAEPVPADEPAEAAKPEADPVEWPPVPTDFPPKKQSSRGRGRQRPPPADPLEWPPIPGDMFAAPQTTAAPGLWEASGVPQERSLGAPAHEQSQAPTEMPVAEVQPVEAEVAAADAPAAAAPAPSEVDPLAVVAPWDLAPAAEPTPAAEPAPAAAPSPAAEPADDDVWMLRSVEAAPRPTSSPVPPARPPARVGSVAQEDPGAVFARYAAGVNPAAERPEMLPSLPAEPLGRAQAGAGDGGDDLWFLANEPSSADAAEDAELEPSSVQTAAATVLVAAIVIGLVIVFLLLFTSVFR